ncbi:AHH domain-containing protein [Simiduia curdlanivorans]|uniref:AHH domain-containing protein n=1 Tax=Simiduia curdlanivorans TaxID=1492769 RepID=A0ABV8V9P3_9GAMM|nr:AHH domain-containing protein [Simiduia curdlanivorans]MDN3638770.1 AHH domain-containing protein [Simiduia curdlanivorans]
MPKPISSQKYVFKDPVSRKIDWFASLDKPTLSDLRAVETIAQIECGLDTYRCSVEKMSQIELEAEAHQSKRLAEFMEITSDPRPHPKCHAHAIVSGHHKLAVTQRAVLAWLKVRIDDPVNGCWLPRNTAAKSEMPSSLKNAVPHSRIHRYNYYFWLDRVISFELTTTPDSLMKALKMIELRLQAGKPPSYVMNKKGVGLPL